MRKIIPALFFTLLLSATANTASLYILYDQACMDRLEYVDQNTNKYVVYHVNTSPGKKVILEVGTESATPQDFPPAQVIRCNNAVFDEKLVNAINSKIDQVFMAVRKGNGQHLISPIISAALYSRTETEITYDSPRYRFKFDIRFGSIGENIALKNPNTEVAFEGTMDNQCTRTLLFRQTAEFADYRYANIELIPEIGIVEERRGASAEDALRNILRLDQVNGRKLDKYLRQICTGEKEPEAPAAATDIGKAPEVLSTTGPRLEDNTAARGETPAPRPAASSHTVRKGETLYSISKKYNVSVENLRAWNNKGNSNLIRVGEQLQVSQAAATEARIPAEPTGYEQTESPARAPALVARTAGDAYHIVRPGETVASIAMSYGYTEQRFRQFNGLGSQEAPRIGQALKTSDCDCPEAPSGATGVTGSGGQLAPETRYYHSGLSSRSAELTALGSQKSSAQAPAPEESFDEDQLGGRSYTQEYEYINTPLFVDHDRLGGQSAAQPSASVVPVQRQYSAEGEFYSVAGPRLDSGAGGGGAASSGTGLIGRTFSSRAPAAAGTVREYSSTYSPNAGSSFYVVKEGDTLYSIARMYGITVERLREINNLGANEVIIPYQKIYLN